MLGKMLGSARGLGAVVLLFAAVTAYATQAPQTEKAVPVYPGAQRDQAVEAERDPAQAGQSHATYVTTDSPEKVFQYYLKQLGAVPEDLNRMAQPPKPGISSPVFYTVDFYDESDLQDAGQALRKRAPYQAGHWVKNSNYVWNACAADGSAVTEFSLAINDEALANGPENYQARTVIEVSANTSKYAAEPGNTGEQGGREPAEKTNPFIGKAVTAKSKPFTGKALTAETAGVALYPGAKYDAVVVGYFWKILAQNAACYRSNDPVQKVVEFYRQQKSLDFIAFNEGVAMFRRNKKKFNQYLGKEIAVSFDLDITVQSPWQDMRTGKLMKDTLISFVKHEQAGGE